jgi:hypothetical protein
MVCARWYVAPMELFSRGNLRLILASTTERVEEEVNKAPEEHVLRVDVEAWVAAIVELRKMAPPTLGEPWVESKEVTPGVLHAAPGLTGFLVTVHIPFTGDGAIFIYQPSTFASSFPVARLEQGELLRGI